MERHTSYQPVGRLRPPSCSSILTVPFFSLFFGLFFFCFFLHEGCILSFKKKKKDPLVFLCFHFVFQRCITMNAHQLTGKGLYELTVV